MDTEECQRHSAFGNYVEWRYSREADTPGDIDSTTKYPEKQANELVKVIEESTGKKTFVRYEPFHWGYQAKVGEGEKAATAIDIRGMGTYYSKTPYNWKSKSAVIIDGIPFESIGEQLLRQGATVLNSSAGINGRDLWGQKRRLCLGGKRTLRKCKLLLAYFMVNEPVKQDVSVLAAPHFGKSLPSPL